MNNDNLIPILEKDFDELVAQEIQTLRNSARKTFKLNARYDGSLSDDKVFQFYLNEKRTHVPVAEMENLLIQPITQIVGGVFISKGGYVSMTVPTWDGTVMATYSTGNFIIKEPIILAVLSVKYHDSETLVYCLSPAGNFCLISSRQFAFEI